MDLALVDLDGFQKDTTIINIVFKLSKLGHNGIFLYRQVKTVLLMRKSVIQGGFKIIIVELLT